MGIYAEQAADLWSTVQFSGELNDGRRAVRQNRGVVIGIKGN